MCVCRERERKKRELRSNCTFIFCVTKTKTAKTNTAKRARAREIAKKIALNLIESGSVDVVILLLYAGCCCCFFLLPSSLHLIPWMRLSYSPHNKHLFSHFILATQSSHSHSATDSYFYNSSFSLFSIEFFASLFFCTPRHSLRRFTCSLFHSIFVSFGVCICKFHCNYSHFDSLIGSDAINSKARFIQMRQFFLFRRAQKNTRFF